MGTKTKIAGLAVALMVLSVPMVYADNGGSDKGAMQPEGQWHHGQKDDMTAQILNLSDDQAKQLKDNRQKKKEAVKGLFEQIKANRQAFESELVKATADMSKINDIQIQFKGLQSQMADIHLNSILEIKKSLSPEQFAGYMALEKEEDLMKHHMMGHDKVGHEHEGQD